MLDLRLVTLIATLAIVAAACGSGSSPGATGSATPEPNATAGTPSDAPATTEPSPSSSGFGGADLSHLRVSTSSWSTDFTIASVDLGGFASGGVPKDGIPAVDDPKFESIAEAETWLAPNAPVISLVVDGQARAYPLAVLIWHEIANDTLGGVPVVVTFCPLCHTALVFERTVDGTLYDFGTTGNLRFSDLVMYDRQTESWWQQATGQALVGTLTGTALTFLPAQIVSLADFKIAHPDSDVLSRDTGNQRPYGANPYPGYDTANERPFLYEGGVDGRLAPKERIVTVARGDKTIAVPYSALEAEGAIEIDTSPEPTVVFWTPGTAAALDENRIDDGRDVGATGVFVPIVDGQRLTFSRDGDRDAPIKDAETGSTWSVTGLATAGELAGSRLEPVVAGDHFWFAWAVFQPDTEVYGL